MEKTNDAKYDDAVLCVKAVLGSTITVKRKTQTIGDFLGLSEESIPAKPFPHCTYFEGGTVSDGMVPWIWRDIYHIGYKVRLLGGTDAKRVMDNEKWTSRFSALKKARKTLTVDLEDFSFNKACPAALNSKPLTLMASMDSWNLQEHESTLLRDLIKDLLLPQLFLVQWLDSIEKAMKNERDNSHNNKYKLVEAIAYGEKPPLYPNDSPAYFECQSNHGLWHRLGKPRDVHLAKTIAEIAGKFGHEIKEDTIRKDLHELKAKHK